MGFRINRVYTRSGDGGKTGLVGGERISKAAPRVEAIGALDELNAQIGLVKESLSPHTRELHELLEFLQQELFDLGAEVATPPGKEYEGMWRTTGEHVRVLESLCDRFGEELEELKSFILPGGSPAAAALHLARTAARRAERCLARLVEAEPGEPQALSPELMSYVNRLSDLLFNLARWSLLKEGKTPPLWRQEKDRELPEKFRG